MINIVVDASFKDDLIGFGMVIVGASEEGILTVSKIIRNPKRFASDVAESEGILMAYEYAKNTLRNYPEPILIVCDNETSIAKLKYICTDKITIQAYSDKKHPGLKPVHAIAHNASRLYMPLLQTTTDVVLYDPTVLPFKSPVTAGRHTDTLSQKQAEEIRWKVELVPYKKEQVWVFYQNDEVIGRSRKLNPMIEAQCGALVVRKEKIKIIVNETIWGILTNWKKSNTLDKGDLTFIKRTHGEKDVCL